MFQLRDVIDSLCFQDYLLSHMYGNAARDDLWSKLSQVTVSCVAPTHLGRAVAPPRVASRGANQSERC